MHEKYLIVGFKDLDRDRSSDRLWHAVHVIRNRSGSRLLEEGGQPQLMWDGWDMHFHEVRSTHACRKRVQAKAITRAIININCFPSPHASIFKCHIKIDYLIKSHMHWQFFVEMLF